MREASNGGTELLAEALQDWRYKAPGLVLAAMTGEVDRFAGSTQRTLAYFDSDGMYDAAALPHYWDGFAFTQGRLP